ncbi:MAG: C-type lectin domain-containing protein [Deltaproteobacteria bacterium]|nr:C-type lectin domain-containing protein [Deltaproteobacteria bacterium]
MIRYCRYIALVILFILVACTDNREDLSARFNGVRASGAADACIDQDGDGYGENCTHGRDCDDTDPEVTKQCVRCAHVAEGCPCENGRAPISCFLDPTETDSGRVVCHEGTRFCRQGRWSGCETIRTYFAVDSVQTAALIDPDAGVPTCNRCNPNCYRVTDSLDAVDGGIGFETCDNICWAESGGIRLTTDEEPDICHDGASVSVEPPICIEADPQSGTTGSNPEDYDCDGIPNAYDPNPNQKEPGATNPPIFMRLGPGDTAVKVIKAALKPPPADIYFLLDQGLSMSDERSALLERLTSGGSCAEHADCPSFCFEGRCFGSKTACISHGECEGYCVDNLCRLLDDDVICRDVDGDGAPNDELKSQGILGSIRCMVDQPRFGAGFFDELPFAPYSESYQEKVYQHLSDIGAYDDTSLSSLLSSVQGNAEISSDLPDAQTQALWSIASAQSLYLGWDRASTPAPPGCPQNAFGYPCFSRNALPVVFLLTDGPFHNGPNDEYDYPEAFPIAIDPAWFSGDDLLEVVASNDTVFTAFDAGVLSGSHIGFTGSTDNARGVLSDGHLGCASSSRVNEAYFRFDIEKRERLTISTKDSDFDTLISLYREIEVDNTNENASTAFDISARLGSDLCGRRVKLLGDTSGMRSDYSGDFVADSPSNQTPDAIFKFSLSQETRIRIDTEGSQFNTMFALYKSNVPFQPEPLAHGGTKITESPDEDCSQVDNNGHSYFFCRNNRDFFDAHGRCGRLGMSLATIDDANENAFIKSQIVSASLIGAHDQYSEGRWQWADSGKHFWIGGAWTGYPVNGLYNNWDFGEPNDSLEEDCAEIYLSGTWNDTDCSDKQDYICETVQVAPSIVQTLPAGEYYIIIKGKGTASAGRYVVTIQDRDASTLWCNNDSGTLETSEMTPWLDPGRYLLVLTGNQSGEQGPYRLYIWSQSFVPQTWEQTIAALRSNRIRVMTVLSCDEASQASDGSTPCSDSFDDAASLAIATEATAGGDLPLVLQLDKPSAVSSTIVAGIQQLYNNLNMDVALQIVPEPDSNPFDTRITAASADTPSGCEGVTEAEFLNCPSASEPEFSLEFINPAEPNSVPAEPDAYAFKVQIVEDNRYVVDEVAIYIVAEPEPVTQQPTYTSGAYQQDVYSVGCSGKTRPDWRVLQWSADVPDGSRLIFKACTSESKEGLDNCIYRTIATVSATGSTEEIEGGDCDDDADCSPLSDCQQGECSGIAECVGNRCIYAGPKADIGIGLGAENNYRRFLRLKIDLLTDSETSSSTPLLFGYQLDYVCTEAE